MQISSYLTAANRYSTHRLPTGRSRSAFAPNATIARCCRNVVSRCRLCSFRHYAAYSFFSANATALLSTSTPCNAALSRQSRRPTPRVRPMSAAASAPCLAFMVHLPLPPRFSAIPSNPPKTLMCDTSYRTSARSSEQRARDFLTQRSVQQTMFCSRVLRDETTTRWLEHWLDHRGLDDLHHCDALNISSHQYISSLLKQPPVVLQIKKPIPGRTNNKNPHIRRRYYCYDVQIDPRSLARRILQARKQIADELAVDIPCIKTENHRTLELYRTSVLDPANLNTNPLNMPSNGDTRGSPYRQANFDLVKNYTLYLALIDTVQELAENTRTEEDAEWMRNFFERHAESLLQPYHGRFGEAERVISQLLSATPCIRGGKLLFDPGLLTEMVFTHRVACSQRWLDVMQKAPVEHLEFERALLEEIL